MGELWTTVASRLLAAIEPLTTLDVGTDSAFARSACAAAAAWGGRVVLVAPDSGCAPPANLEPRSPYGPATVTGVEHPDLVVLHGEPNPRTATWQLAAVAAAADAEHAPLPPIVIAHVGAPHDGVLTAVEGFVHDRGGLETIVVPGLGGAAIILGLDAEGPPSDGVQTVLDEFRLPEHAVRLVEAVDADLRDQLAHAAQMSSSAGVPGAAAAETEELRIELEALRGRIGELVAQLADERERADEAQALASALEDLRYGPGDGSDSASPPSAPVTGNGSLANEPTRALVRELLAPGELLRSLGWPGDEVEIALPIPVDRRGIIQPDSPHSLVVIAGEDPLALRRTLCSVLERTDERLALTVAVAPGSSQPLADLLAQLELAVPELELVDAIAWQPRPGAQRLQAGEELPWGWPHPPAASELPEVAYLLPGMPAEGSGGANSVVQEARGLRKLGVPAHICLPTAALARAERLYGNGDSLFVAYASDAGILDAIRMATVAVATEHTSVGLLARLVAARPELVAAYYVQDYEPLFAELGSARSDQALLSYGALPGAVLFAKSHFIANVVSALHGVQVAKVVPSLDRSIFNSEGRSLAVAPRLRVTAMLRPRTPRRRPLATLRALALIETAMADEVELVTFGCDPAEVQALGTRVPTLRHLGKLRSDEVADQFRRSDVFIDGSAYQAFGRSGLEAMACGAVPLLPSLGGTSEYAVDGHNALVLADDSPSSVAHAVTGLAADRARLDRLRAAGQAAAREFSIERAALSQLDLLRFAHTSRRSSAPS